TAPTKETVHDYLCERLRAVKIYTELNDNNHIIDFFFNDASSTEIYTLSLHDALPISCASLIAIGLSWAFSMSLTVTSPMRLPARSEEHTSELQSQSNLVCRLLLEKKNYPAAAPMIRHDPAYGGPTHGPTPPSHTLALE